MKEKNKKIVILVLLFLLVILCFYLNFLPRIDYKYPIHVDEFKIFTFSKHLSHGSPLYYEKNIFNDLEIGFILLISILNFEGIPYLLIFKFFPAFLSILIALSLFILVKKIWNIEAALFSVFFFVVLKNTNLLLGQMFLVPVSIGLLFIPLSLYLAISYRKILFLIIAPALIIHPPSGIACLILINCFLISKLIKRQYKKADIKQLLSQQILGIILALPLYIAFLIKKPSSLVTNLQFSFPDFAISNTMFLPRYLGLTIMVLSILGFFFLFNKKKYALPIFSIILLILIIMFNFFNKSFLLMYERSLIYLLEVFVIFSAIASERIINISKNKYLKLILLILLIVFLSYTLIPQKVESAKKINLILNQEDYDNFIFIKELDQEGKALLDPWKALAFPAIAEMEVYAYLPSGHSPVFNEKLNKINLFLNQECKNTTFLTENNITLIYTDVKCNNTDLIQLKERIYVLK